MPFPVTFPLPVISAIRTSCFFLVSHDVDWTEIFDDLRLDADPLTVLNSDELRQGDRC